MSSLKGLWRRKGKKKWNRGSKRKQKVWFSNIVETICLSDSSESEDSSSDDGTHQAGMTMSSYIFLVAIKDGFDTSVANDILSARSIRAEEPRIAMSRNPASSGDVVAPHRRARKLCARKKLRKSWPPI